MEAKVHFTRKRVFFNFPIEIVLEQISWKQVLLKIFEISLWYQKLPIKDFPCENRV